SCIGHRETLSSTKCVASHHYSLCIAEHRRHFSCLSKYNQKRSSSYNSNCAGTCSITSCLGQYTPNQALSTLVQPLRRYCGKYTRSNNTPCMFVTQIAQSTFLS